MRYQWRGAACPDRKAALFVLSAILHNSDTYPCSGASGFIKAIGAEILKIPKEKRKQGLSFHVEQINLLAFFKQVISMFCSLNTEQFGISFKDFLLNESSTNFDTSIYKVCMYLHAGRVDRLVPFQTQLNIKTGHMEFCSEISTFPVGFIFYDISHNRTTSFCGSDITSFSQCDYSSLYNLDMRNCRSRSALF